MPLAETGFFCNRVFQADGGLCPLAIRKYRFGAAPDVDLLYALLF